MISDTQNLNVDEDAEDPINKQKRLMSTQMNPDPEYNLGDNIEPIKDLNEVDENNMLPNILQEEKTSSMIANAGPQVDLSRVEAHLN